MNAKRELLVFKLPFRKGSKLDFFIFVLTQSDLEDASYFNCSSLAIDPKNLGISHDCKYISKVSIIIGYLFKAVTNAKGVEDINKLRCHGLTR